MYDLIIVGAGPAGLSAAVYASRAGLKLLVLEQNPMSGGQVLNTYEVDNYLGMPDISGFDMGMQFRAHADKLGVPFQNAQVLSVADDGDKIVLRTAKEMYEAKAVIWATGAGRAHLGVPGEEEFAGRGVSYCATCDGAFFRGKTVAVIGGGNTALEDAIYLARTCEKVYLIHRRDELRGAASLQESMKQLSNIEILYSHEVTAICGQEIVESVELLDKKKDETKKITVAGVFIAVGSRPNTELIEDMITLDENGYVPAAEDCITDRPGLFVAGDIRRKPMRQIVTAVADGANAAASAAQYCRQQA